MFSLFSTSVSQPSGLCLRLSVGVWVVLRWGFASIGCWMLKSAEQQNWDPTWGQSCIGSTTIRFFGWAAGLALPPLNGRKRGKSV